MKREGRVTLVGAGPGDAGLLSRRGEAVLKTAQVVLADRLVGPGVLSLIPPDAEVIPVGKESGYHPIPQGEINRILVEKAGEGKRVVRLKGGDPYLFGRGAEELEEVIARGIPWEVVPGVTASIAVPEWAGIPVTHRSLSSSVHILTGHAREGAPPGLDYRSLVRLGGTLVFMMAFTALEGILNGLMEAGMEPEMPAALIQNGTLPSQRKLTATVAVLHARAVEAGMAAPAVLVVGKVCALSEKLDWRSGLPLHGKTVLVTRPQSAGGTLAEELESLGCGVVRFPCIRLSPRNTALPDLSRYGWLVFTSAFGVEVFFDLLREAGRDVRSLAGVKLAAVGSRTAGELGKRGILPDFVPEVYDTAHLAEGLTGRVKPGGRVLLLRAGAGSRELPEILGRNQVDYTDLAIYDTAYQSPVSAWVPGALARGEINYVTFTSASTVDGFAGAVGGDAWRGAAFVGVCIGECTARRARQWGIETIVSEQATVDSMITAIQKHARGDHL